MSKCHRCLTSKQVSYQNKTLKYLSNIKAFLTCHCLIKVVSISHAINGCSPRVPQGANKLKCYKTLTPHTYTQTHTNTHTWPLKDSFFLCHIYRVVDVICLSQVVVLHLNVTVSAKTLHVSVFYIVSCK